MSTVGTNFFYNYCFSYPERPIIFICGCHCVVAAVYVVGFAVEEGGSSGFGTGLACAGPFPPQDVGVEFSAMRRVVVQGTKKEMCTIAFMTIYYFGMSSSIWWVVLTLTWFLSAGLKWSNEAIERNSQVRNSL